MTYEVNDIVRIIRADPGTMIGPYVGSEATILDVSPDKPGLYMVEIDTGRAQPYPGGQMGPRFIVREDMIGPDVTEAMVDAAERSYQDYTGPVGETVVGMPSEFFPLIYRAMRAARRK